MENRTNFSHEASTGRTENARKCKMFAVFLWLLTHHYLHKTVSQVLRGKYLDQNMTDRSLCCTWQHQMIARVLQVFPVYKKTKVLEGFLEWPLCAIVLGQPAKLHKCSVKNTCHLCAILMLTGPVKGEQGEAHP